MKIKITGILISFFIMPLLVRSQDLSNRRVKTIFFKSDTVIVDSLSLVPEFLKVYNFSGKEIDTSFFWMDFPASRMIIRRYKFETSGLQSDSLVIHYRVFPLLLDEAVKHKDMETVRPDLSGRVDPFAYTPPKVTPDIFGTEGISKSGSISRGISFGNNQDLSVNSNLNLQLSGKLTPKIDLLMVATDNNIPIQAEGNTRQLQEFDKVFIQLSEGKAKLLAGDFQLLKPTGYFMNYNKKAQGANFSTILDVGEGQKGKEYLKTSLSAAVSKGKFAKYEIKGIDSRSGVLGIEGNQGPYRLRGAENEQFIIVLSGTEKVYMDGELLQRGQDADYVIDYNTSEITFMPGRMVTKDKRIIVEFQYSDKNYARSLFATENEYVGEKLRIRLNAFSEQDSKNQPLQQELTIDQKRILRQIGDSLREALYPGYDSVGFSGDEVRYKKTDTTVLSVLHKDVFVFSTIPDSAYYRVSFSFVGAGRGDYIQVQSAANGRVFQWIAPVGGVKQGNYVPQIVLITPKKKQMLTAGADYFLRKNTRISVESAISNNDLNTFSQFNTKDDAGYAVKTSIENIAELSTETDSLKKTKQWKFITGLDYEMVGKTFSPLERFRLVEFERDWNRMSPQINTDQHTLGASLSAVKGSEFLAAYRFNSFLEGSFYEGMKHLVSTRADKSGFLFTADGSYLQSQSVSANTEFLRQRSFLAKRMKWMTLGVKSMYEQNRFKNPVADTLLLNSFSFYEWEAFISSPDTMKSKFILNYKQRSDFVPVVNSFRAFSFAEEIGASADFRKNPKHQFSIGAIYRNLDYWDTIVSLSTPNKPGSTITGRTEYSANLLKGVIYSSTFYEIGNGLESKKEFSYLEVAAGQGVYAWTDYNNNEIKELNEFEVAKFPDQAKFIRVYTPTNEYVKTYSSQFSQVLTLKPAGVWSAKSGIRKIVALFANQSAYRIDRKTTNREYEIAYNPFLQEAKDTALMLLNSSLRNTTFFNQGGSVFGFDFTFQDLKNKSLFINGFETRISQYEEFRVRFNVSRQWSFFLNGKQGKKISASDYFSSRDYSIRYYEAEPKVSFQPSNSFRASGLFKYTQKNNEIKYGGQASTLLDYGMELRYSISGKGSFEARMDFIQIKYNEKENTSLSFEMLEGLRKGNNITWNLSWQQNLSNNLQLSFTYDGRKSEGNKTIHTGGVQVRAMF